MNKETALTSSEVRAEIRDGNIGDIINILKNMSREKIVETLCVATKIVDESLLHNVCEKQVPQRRRKTEDPFQQEAIGLLEEFTSQKDRSIALAFMQDELLKKCFEINKTLSNFGLDAHLLTLLGVPKDKILKHFERANKELIKKGKVKSKDVYIITTRQMIESEFSL